MAEDKYSSEDRQTFLFSRYESSQEPYDQLLVFSFYCQLSNMHLEKYIIAHVNAHTGRILIQGLQSIVGKCILSALH